MSRVGLSLVSLLLACGCNAILGLTETELADGGFHKCPPIGETPEYTTLPKVVIDGRFPSSYTFDERRNLAVADTDTIVEGPVDSDQLVPADLDREVGETLDMPKLSPEGDELFVRRRVGITLDYSVVLFQRAGSRWQRVATLPIPIGGQDQLGVPSRRAGGRRLVMYAGGAIIELREYEDTGVTWPLVNTYTRAAFGLESFSEPQITGDGLRLVFSGNVPGGLVREVVMISDRASTAEPFSPPREMLALSGTTEAREPFMTTDCSRLYFVAFPGLNYVEL